MSRGGVKISIRTLTWSPYLEPVALAEASPKQLAAMQVTPSHTKVSPYVRTLAHDPESYVARTTLFNNIMYSEGGLGRAERELGALVASAVNGCAYCGSVHARRYEELSGRNDVVSTIYTQGVEAVFDDDTQVLVDFCRALSQTPIALEARHIQALHERGLSRADIVDLIHSAAIFGWANRLMHTLGHAVAAVR
ncbi:peroxidase-related enzyme [Pectobacterium versatile]|uniref:peroxidase-related enzyme n=1 Tax=Pectobacterium versatile TaxID=2488639 RepID=UPI002009F75B|nr:peroxidase-related enzyme [Pectobacterium versatile]